MAEPIDAVTNALPPKLRIAGGRLEFRFRELVTAHKPYTDQMGFLLEAFQQDKGGANFPTPPATFAPDTTFNPTSVIPAYRTYMSLLVAELGAEGTTYPGMATETRTAIVKQIRALLTSWGWA